MRLFATMTTKLRRSVFLCDGTQTHAELRVFALSTVGQLRHAETERSRSRSDCGMVWTSGCDIPDC